MVLKNAFGIACGLSLLAGSAFALPTAKEVYANMGLGYNIGNTLEAPKDPTSWGNDFPTQELIDSVKSAGFNTVRIPCAWYSHTTDADSMTISTGWMDSVKTVVDYVVNKNMYAILNIHWDSGWMEENISESVNETINKRQENFWKQIATKFANYDEHLLFASMNEPGMNTTDFTAARTQVLNTYHETMMNTVRATGGNNATRTIIVQAPYTDEAKMHKWWKQEGSLPVDPAGSNYMMAEFHFYPYQFSLMEEDADWGNTFRYWGEGNYSTTDEEHNANYNKNTKATDDNLYAGPNYVDSVFAMIADDFDMPIVIGEFGAIKRLDLVGENLKLHLQSRAAFYGKVAALSKKHGFVPCIWDTGNEGDGNMTIIRRNKNRGILDYESLNAMREAYGMSKLNGNSIDSLVALSVDTTNRAVKLTYTSATSDSSEVGTFRINTNGKDLSDYVGLSFLAKYDVKTLGPAGGKEWSTLSLFAMSGESWDWSDYNFDAKEIVDGWAQYNVSFDDDGLNIKDLSKVNAIGLNLYGTQLSGELLIDNMILWKKDGSADTLASFNKAIAAEAEGIATMNQVVTPEITNPASVGEIPTGNVTTDENNKALLLTYTTTGRVDSSETGTFRIALNGANWSNYTAIAFQAKVDVKSEGPLSGEKYGWTSLSTFAMSGEKWDWADYSFKAEDISTSWKTYTIPLSASGLNIKNKTSVQAFGINLYGTQPSGTITIDNIILIKADGTMDTLSNFNKKIGADIEGIATAELVVSDAPAMTDIKAPTATTTTPTNTNGNTAIKPAVAAASKMFVNVQQGYVNATFSAANAGMGSAKLINGLGQVIAAQSFTAHAGNNTVQLKAAYRGPAMLMVKQGSQSYIQKVILK